jgi:hypothetical protein
MYQDLVMRDNLPEYGASFAKYLYAVQGYKLGCVKL